ncbi:MAG: hypothetical protein ACXVA7_14365 [Isosphaeraceae bacterium]
MITYAGPSPLLKRMAARKTEKPGNTGPAKDVTEELHPRFSVATGREGGHRVDGHSPKRRFGMPKIDDVTLSSLKQTIKIVVSLAPLFAFWFIAMGHSLVRLQIGVYTGIALLIVMAWARLTRGTMLWATGTFFVVALVLAVWLKNVWVIRHLGIFPSAILFVAVMLSMILDRPFVEDYACEDAPPEQRESVSFVRTCFVLTSFWAAMLLIMALLSVVQMAYPGPGQLMYLIVQLAVLALALAYQAAYIVHVKHKRLASTKVSGPLSPPGT